MIAGFVMAGVCSISSKAMAEFIGTFVLAPRAGGLLAGVLLGAGMTRSPMSGRGAKCHRAVPFGGAALSQCNPRP
ncbi:hypothetical protein [Paracoccus amoyensis]|uniref:hypothetical protein n=1 Tax=Paracoccus amoyensis TaxID=2760093 RepID=UPI001659AE07|nr:hypothetical protein [Paracoccus amoyensis]